MTSEAEDTQAAQPQQAPANHDEETPDIMPDRTLTAEEAEEAKKTTRSSLHSWPNKRQNTTTRKPVALC
jgi:hypothetical protein